MKSSPKRILVIGGSGFIGETLIPNLLSDGNDVSVLNRGNRLMKGTHQITADRKNPIEVKTASESTGNFDVVIDTSSYNGQNTEIAWQSFSKKTEHWIHLGSAAVYKETPNRFPTEKDEIGGAPIWAEYGEEKSEAEQFLINHSSEVPVTILRPPYLYGPGNDNDRESFIWSRILVGRPILIPNNGKTQIQFLHVEDLSNAFKTVMYNPPKDIAIYNVAAIERPTLSEWVDVVAKIAGGTNSGILAETYADNYKPRQFFPFRDYPCCISVDLITLKLGWEPNYRLEEGFKQTFETYDLSFLKNKKLDTTVEDQILSNISKKKSYKT